MREDRNLDSVIRARDGDLDAFESMVHEYTPAAYRLAAAIAGESMAGDVVQDAFLAAWRELQRLRDPEKFSQWLHRIVANRSRSIMRKRRAIREIPLSSQHETWLTVEIDGLQAAEARAMVASSFERLTIDQRTLLGLHYAARLSIREVAEVLDIPVGTAKSRLAATLATLRNDVGGDGR